MKGHVAAPWHFPFPVRRGQSPGNQCPLLWQSWASSFPVCSRHWFLQGVSCNHQETLSRKTLV